MSQNRVTLFCGLALLKEAVMASEKNCWWARAVKVPTVGGVQESLQTVCLKRLKKGTDFRKCRRCMES